VAPGSVFHGEAGRVCGRVHEAVRSYVLTRVVMANRETGWGIFPTAPEEETAASQTVLERSETLVSEFSCTDLARNIGREQN
jgi:hypothetical protein